MKSKLLLVHALSPLHAGTGQGVGVLDLPIAREKGTHYPYLAGSSLKGVMRDAFNSDAQRKADVIALFGPETTNASDHAGSLVFSDQRLLLFPVRSLKGTFAWVTCPLVLERFRRDCLELGVRLSGAGKEGAAGKDNRSVPVVQEGQALVTGSSTLHHQQKVFLEDLDLTASVQAGTDAWAGFLSQTLFPVPKQAADEARKSVNESWQKQLKQRLCVVSDDVFSFLVETATEIIARIRLQEDTKTVAQGGLWYEENLPAESILSGIVAFMPNQKTGLKAEQAFQHLSHFNSVPVQLGGKATIGRGLCRVVFHQN